MLRDYEVDLNEPVDNSGKCLLHTLIVEDDLQHIKLILKLPEDFKSKSADSNKIDLKFGWTPLFTAINHARGSDSLLELLRNGADPNL